MRKRQREGTLERVVKYDVEAFKTAWDYLADEEEEAFAPPPLPWEGVKNGHFWPDSFFFSRGRMQGDAREKKKNGFQPEKRSRFKKKHRLRHRTPLRGRTNITIQTYGTEEVY